MATSSNLGLTCEMEICVDSLESARNAIDGGATRLEVCSALSEGGLTPTIGMVRQIRTFSRLPLHAMLRVRSGDFIYSEDEMTVMLHDLKYLKQHVNGFVFGALTPGSEVDMRACARIISAARPAPVTFHRAFDELADPVAALDILVQLGFQRVLTSGQKDTAPEGLELIATLVQRAANRIVVMPGSGIKPENIARVKRRSGAREFHASAGSRKLRPGGANKVRMGKGADPGYTMVTDADLVRKMVSGLKDC